MKKINRFEIEIMRHNVTPAQFLAYVRARVDKKGGRYLRGDLDLEYFKAGNDLNFNVKHVDDENAGLREISVSRPYEMQTYLRYPNGAMYNEICEFEFDNEKTGTGYYYLINIEVIEAEETPIKDSKRELRKGDKIVVPVDCGRFSVETTFTIREIKYQEPFEWRNAYYVDFIDENGRFHQWQQRFDGGRAVLTEEV